MTWNEALAARGRWVRDWRTDKLYRVRLVVGALALVVDVDGRGTCLHVSDLSPSGYVAYPWREWSLVRKYGATERTGGYTTRGVETGRTRSDRPNPGYLPNQANVALDKAVERLGLRHLVAEPLVMDETTGGTS